MKKGRESLALLLVIFLMLMFSLFAMVLASVFSNRTEIAQGFSRSIQVFYINDMGMERAKQILKLDWTWSPPDPPGYLEENVSIDGLNGNYRIYLQESDSEKKEITVESTIQ